MDDNPPPSDVKGLTDRLVAVNDPGQTSLAIAEKVSIFEKEVESIEEWNKFLGYDEIKMPLLQKVNANCKLTEVQANVEEILSRILEFKHNEFDRIIDKCFPKEDKAGKVLDSMSARPFSGDIKGNEEIDSKMTKRISGQPNEELGQKVKK